MHRKQATQVALIVVLDIHLMKEALNARSALVGNTAIQEILAVEIVHLVILPQEQTIQVVVLAAPEDMLLVPEIQAVGIVHLGITRQEEAIQAVVRAVPEDTLLVREIQVVQIVQLANMHRRQATQVAQIVLLDIHLMKEALDARSALVGNTAIPETLAVEIVHLVILPQEQAIQVVVLAAPEDTLLVREIQVAQSVQLANMHRERATQVAPIVLLDIHLMKEALDARSALVGNTAIPQTLTVEIVHLVILPEEQAIQNAHIAQLDILQIEAVLDALNAHKENTVALVNLVVQTARLVTMHQRQGTQNAPNAQLDTRLRKVVLSVLNAHRENTVVLAIPVVSTANLVTMHRGRETQNAVPVMLGNILLVLEIQFAILVNAVNILQEQALLNVQTVQLDIPLKKVALNALNAPKDVSAVQVILVVQIVHLVTMLREQEILSVVPVFRGDSRKREFKLYSMSSG